MTYEYVYETIEEGGYTIQIVADMNPMSPREWDQLGHMLCRHPDYILGDEQFKHVNGRGAVERAGGSAGSFESMDEVVEFIRDERKGINLIPLFLYDHSGITISAGSTIPDGVPPAEEDITVERGSFASRTITGGYSWDTSMVGFIYTTEELIEKMGAPRDSIDKQLRNEVKEYDDFLTGNVWGYVITKVHEECGEIDCPHSEVEDSCWGYIGDPKYAIEDARAALPAAVV